MDAKKKKTLEECMVAVPDEEMKAERPSDMILLDEPKRRVWLTILLYLVTFSIIGVFGLFIYQKYQNKEILSVAEKIEGEVLAENKPVAKYVYVESEGGANLRSTASASSDPVILIPDKTKLEVLGIEDDWINVSYSDYKGWIRQDLTLQP